MAEFEGHLQHLPGSLSAVIVLEVFPQDKRSGFNRIGTGPPPSGQLRARVLLPSKVSWFFGEFS